MRGGYFLLKRGRGNFFARKLALALLVFSVPVASARPPALPPQARYVAMGSSFAAGPLVTTSADQPANRCDRSRDNYAHQLARKRNLVLVDVSCSGATTAHLSGPWDELPAQLDALTPDTKLVTVTIGGNDVGYIGGLIASSCRFDELAQNNREAAAACYLSPAPDEETWRALEVRMTAFAREVARRAPVTQLVFVEYLTILPRRGSCRTAPITAGDADNARAVNRRLTALTGRVVQSVGASLLRVGLLSRNHGVCAKQPWVSGYDRYNPAKPYAPYHPNLAGMTAIAGALNKMLPS